MSFLEFLFLSILLFLFCYVLLWICLDCNVALWYCDRFGGVPLSTLRGKVIWITGASSGIGKHLALTLARQGAKLVLTARRKELLEELKRDCLKQAAGLLEYKDVLVLPMDMLKTGWLHMHSYQHVLEYFGQIDILVNNAGRSQRAPWELIDLEVDRELFELNVFSVLGLSRVVMTHFFIKGRGHLVATSSLAGVGLAPYSASYCASKHALNAYYNALRLEYPSIDVTLFAPGPIETDFLQEAFTHRPNEKVGRSSAKSKRMSVERCAHLYAVSIANKLQLSWCGLFPINALAYIMQQPTLTKILMKFMTRQTMNKIREGQ